MQPDILKALDFMLDTAKDNTHGYDQTRRNAPDYDCSSLVGTALNKAGFDVGCGSTTRTLKNQLLACGFKTIGLNDTRKAGDIFLKEGKHVVMSVDKYNIVHASINELGKTTGGKTGDQTGKEICTRQFYSYKGGWDYHFRYTPTDANTTIANQVIKGMWGNGGDRDSRLTRAGYDYKEIQAEVNNILIKNKT